MGTSLETSSHYVQNFPISFFIRSYWAHIIVHRKTRHTEVRHRRAPIGVDECPGNEACSKCDAFGENHQFTCDQSCNMCPLCKIFYVKPGCDYCDQGVSVCQDNCKIGEVICDKCKKYC